MKEKNRSRGAVVQYTEGGGAVSRGGTREKQSTPKPKPRGARTRHGHREGARRAVRCRRQLAMPSDCKHRSASNKHSHSTVTAQSQHSHSTVTAPSPISIPCAEYVCRRAQAGWWWWWCGVDGGGGVGAGGMRVECVRNGPNRCRSWRTHPPSWMRETPPFGEVTIATEHRLAKT